MGQMGSALCAEPRKPKLVIHFDVNETVLVCDKAGGDNLEQCMNKIIARSSLVSEDGKTWEDGVAVGSADNPTELPPLFFGWEVPTGYTVYYGEDRKKVSKLFTEAGKPGQRYRGWYDKVSEALTIPPALRDKIDPRLTLNGTHWFLLPAFYRTVDDLARQGRTFSIVIRTFGTDLDEVIAAVQAYTEGKAHDAFEAFAEAGEPGWTPLHHPPVKELENAAGWNGRYDAETGQFTLTARRVTDESVEDKEDVSDEDTVHTVFKNGSTHGAGVERVSDENAALRLIQGPRDENGVFACMDHYEWWRDHAYAPSSGKPVWIVEDEEQEFHHIFFDDNIHNNPNDSIVAVRVRKHGSEVFEPLTGEETLELQGRNLVRVPTIEPVLNERWFLEQIARCEEKMDRDRPEGPYTQSLRVC